MFYNTLFTPTLSVGGALIGNILAFLLIAWFIYFMAKPSTKKRKLLEVSTTPSALEIQARDRQ